jgi:hypothetical protein
MKFKKVLQKYYEKWYRDCHDSVKYCLSKNKVEKAVEYEKRTIEYFNLINENWDALERKEKT